MDEDNELIKQRLEKLGALKEKGVDPFYNKFKVKNSSNEPKEYGKGKSNEELEAEGKEFVLAGRIMAIRDFGKAAFATIKDGNGQFQLFFMKNSLGDDAYAHFKTFDIGDIIGVKGVLFYTKTKELTLNVKEFKLLTKSLRPLPEKWHGLTDIETRYRQRYVDLLVNSDVKDVFIKRTKIIDTMRDFFNSRGFLEVETPMMHSVPGGAVARPFMTYHNALDMELYMRIAPELYLKRLIVGGFERVYEINRNFRNEGISIQHNPEFTMLEFYTAYAAYNDLMDFTEELIVHTAKEVCGTLKITYQGEDIDLTPPWQRLTVKEAIVKYADIDSDVLEDRGKALAYAKKLGIEIKGDTPLGKIIVEIFDETVEKNLVQPTFITEYPIEVSPLSRKNDDNPMIADRFELFIVRREMANAFSELNDPIDQRERFLEQVREKEKGDLEACEMDEDYIRALSYGMPPTAGEGIGIDRLVMLLTDSASIRDVILFPQLKEKKGKLAKILKKIKEIEKTDSRRLSKTATVLKKIDEIEKTDSKRLTKVAEILRKYENLL
jgi:lysyl-tRNA synthetase class 2